MSLALRSAYGLATNPAFRAGVRYSPAMRTAGLKIAGWAARQAFKRRGRRGTKRFKNFKNKRMVRRRIGMRVGVGNSKRDADVTTFPVSTRTLYDTPLLNLTKGTAIDNRERDLINFRGCKICLSFVNDVSTYSPNGEKLFWNMAIISPKDETTKTTFTTTKFFRGSGSTRYHAFDNNLTALEFRCLPINTDEFNVLKHKRMVLAPYSAVDGTNNKMIEFYWSLNRQIRYEDGTAFPEGKQVYLVQWFDTQNSAAASVPRLVGDMQERVVKYFREPK